MLLQVKNDNLFHDLFNKENMDIIEYIVIKILDLKYEEVHNNCYIENIRLTRNNSKARNKYVDLIIRCNENIIIIELNNNYNGSSIRNIVFGMTEIVNHYSRNNKKYYKDIIRLTLVNLNWFRYDSKNIKSKRIEIINCLEDLSNGKMFQVINVNLDKYETIPYNKIDTRERFYKLITIKRKEELLEFTKGEDLLKNYTNKLIKLSNERKYSEENMTELMEENILREESYHFGKEDGIKEGIEKGIEKGIEQGKIETQKNMVLSMFNDRMPFNLISKYTKISISKIKEIIKANNMDLSK